MPAHIQLRYLQITIRMFMAEGLPVMQTGSFFSLGDHNTMDGYIKIKIGDKLLKTKVVKLEDGSTKIEWNQ